MAELDLEALKRLSWAETRTRWPAVVAALERAERVELDRDMLQRAHDAWQEAAAEWETQARTYIASNAHWRRRFQELETAARRVEAFGWGEDAPAALQTAVLDLRAALAGAPAESAS